jgi:outer membrane protein assembly factor BamB
MTAPALRWLAVWCGYAASSLMAADWPGHLGPQGTSTAPAIAEAAVAAPKDFALVWTCEEAIPDGRSSDGSGKTHSTASGGFASPVLGGGKVVLNYYLPSGAAVDAKHVANAAHKYLNGLEPRRKWAIGADDVVLAIDAASGKTAWKRSFADAGMNWCIHFNKGGPASSPVIAGDAVLAVGTMGILRCLALADGAVRWEAPLPKLAEALAKVKDACVKNQTGAQFNRACSSSPAVSGGVVACSTMYLKVQHPIEYYGLDGGMDLVGYELASGKQLWTVPNALGWIASPTPWEHAGKHYFIVGNSQKEPAGGTLRLIDAATGAVAWERPVGGNGDTLVVAGDLLLGNILAGGNQFGCLRLSAAGAEEVWKLDPLLGSNLVAPPLVLDGRAYLRLGKVKPPLRVIDLASGKEVASSQGPHVAAMGFFIGGSFAGEGRILAQADSAHHGADADGSYPDLACAWYAAKPDGVTLLSEGKLPMVASYTLPVVPALADGRLYLRGPDRIRCYDLRVK